MGAAAALPKKRLLDDVADHLRELVFNGTLAPGTQLVQAQLAQQLGVSRTPLREAFRILERDGLLRSSNGNQTVEVVELSAAELIDMLEVRGALEGLAARLCIQRGMRPVAQKRMSAHLSAMERDAESGDLASYAAHHADFHGELLLSSGNARLARFLPLIRLSSQMHVSRQLAMQGASSELIRTLQRDANTEHRNIWRRIVARDLPGADQAVNEHLERSIERFRAR